jgi:hypothetical protein
MHTHMITGEEEKLKNNRQNRQNHQKRQNLQSTSFALVDNFSRQAVLRTCLTYESLTLKEKLQLEVVNIRGSSIFIAFGSYEKLDAKIQEKIRGDRV